MQTGYTPTSTYDNQLVTGTEWVDREVRSNRHRNSTIKNNKTVITITFKGNVPGVGAMIGTKDKKYMKMF